MQQSSYYGKDILYTRVWISVFNLLMDHRWKKGFDIINIRKNHKWQKFCVCVSLCSFYSFSHCITSGTVSKRKYSISINKPWKYQYCTSDFSLTVSGNFIKDQSNIIEIKNKKFIGTYDIGVLESTQYS